MMTRTRLDDAISDVEYIIDCLRALRSIKENGHDCNTCTKKCDSRRWGRRVTYNCPLWEGER